MQLYKRGDVWHCAFYDNERRRIRRSTGCTDRKAAEARARLWERDAADPSHAAARDATLSQTAERYFRNLDGQVAAGRRSRATYDSYMTKAGHLVRIFEHSDGVTYEPLPLARITYDLVDGYIAQRRREGVGENTIHKELVVLRAMLQTAKSANLWCGDIDTVVPHRFSPAYKPRTRFLTPEALDRLLDELPADRAGVVAFMVATSAEWAAVKRARREDVAPDGSNVLVRGTKNPARHRTVPIESDHQRRLFDFALANARGQAGALFTPWDNNVRRDLRAACKRAGIAPCSPHDLRRTFASWMIQAGVPPHLIAKMMGHRTSKMVELVYAQLRPQDLAGLVRAALARAA